MNSSSAHAPAITDLVNPVPSGGRGNYPLGMADISVGDRVSWNTPQGRTRGTVVERKTRDFTFAGQHFTASADSPSYVVESEKSGERAAHRGASLRKLKS